MSSTFFNGFVHINSIIIAKGSIADNNTVLINSINKNNLPITYLNQKTFLNKYNYKHSQGIVISFYGNLIQDFDCIEFNDSESCYIIIDQIEDPQNLGQILRTCECAGISGIILPKHGSVHLTDRVIQISQGAFINVDLYVVTNIVQTINRLKDNGFWIIGVENGINSKQWHEIDYSNKVGIVFGSEGRGIRSLVLKSCDFLSTIPMSGKINSLNVSATLSAIVFERQRQIQCKIKKNKTF